MCYILSLELYLIIRYSTCVRRRMENVFFKLILSPTIVYLLVLSGGFLKTMRICSRPVHTSYKLY